MRYTYIYVVRRQRFKSLKCKQPPSIALFLKKYFYLIIYPSFFKCKYFCNIHFRCRAKSCTELLIVQNVPPKTRLSFFFRHRMFQCKYQILLSVYHNTEIKKRVTTCTAQERESSLRQQSAGQKSEYVFLKKKERLSDFKTTVYIF